MTVVCHDIYICIICIYKHTVYSIPKYSTEVEYKVRQKNNHITGICKRNERHQYKPLLIKMFRHLLCMSLS